MQIQFIRHVFFGIIGRKDDTNASKYFCNKKYHKHIVHRSNGYFQRVTMQIHSGWGKPVIFIVPVMQINRCNQNIKCAVYDQQRVYKPFWDFDVPPAENKHQRTVIGKTFSEIFEFSYGKKCFSGTAHNINAFCYQCDKTACNCQKKFAFISGVFFLGNNYQQGKCYKNTE